jgi:hypothetical protein
MEFVVAQFIIHVKSDKQAYGNANGEAKNINERIKALAGKISKGNLKVIL